MTTNATETFRAARDQLLALRTDYDRARAEFTWPQLDVFNWAVDWFDANAVGNDAPCLWIVEQDGSEQKISFEQMSRRSSQVAMWLRARGIGRGDRVMIMLGNQVELWESMLACIKLGAVIIPTTPLVGPADIRDRIERGGAQHAIVASKDTAVFEGTGDDVTRIAVGEPVDGWLRYAESASAPEQFEVLQPTHGDEPMLLYFTSGTTSKPKLVEHTQASYPIGHLTTMYWVGLEPGDIHLNISSPGWAKHAWSNVFAPWNAQACVFIYNYTRFDAAALMAVMDRCGVTSFCAPPTVWRMLIQSDLASLRTPPTKVVGAGEPLNPEVIEQVEQAWGATVRDGFGQTEMTLAVSNSPGQPVKPGAMGRPSPGYEVVLVDPATGEQGVSEGEICLRLDPRPLGLMVGYNGDPDKTAEVMRDGVYHTGDVASIDEDGYLTYVGRADDVFKASDYRISPFELESVLLEHPDVAEAAVVPSPDPLRLAVPKAVIVLVPGVEPSAQTARSIFAHSREHLAPYKRIRRLSFGELPKTISGKIRRVELRGTEQAGHATPDMRPAGEFHESDFPDLLG